MGMGNLSAQGRPVGTIGDGCAVRVADLRWPPLCGRRYLTQLLVPALKESGPSRIVWVSSPSETKTPDIAFDNLECAPLPAPTLHMLLARRHTLVVMRVAESA